MAGLLLSAQIFGFVFFRVLSRRVDRLSRQVRWKFNWRECAGVTNFQYSCEFFCRSFSSARAVYVFYHHPSFSSAAPAIWEWDFNYRLLLLTGEAFFLDNCNAGWNPGCETYLKKPEYLSQRLNEIASKIDYSSAFQLKRTKRTVEL